jgi:uncharacterized protein YihD (DUF1040 family)
MRDPKRIDRVLQTVAAYWKQHPDLRLMQLLLNLAYEGHQDPFYLEDELLEERLRQWLRQGH